MSARLRTLARIAAPGFFVSGRLIGGLGLALTALWGCAGRPAPEPPLALRVNGEPVTVAQWAEERRFTGPSDPSGAKALDNLVDAALIGQEGRRLGVGFGARDRAEAVSEAMEAADPGALAESLKALGVSLAEWQDHVARSAEEEAVAARALGTGLGVSRQEMLDRYWDRLLHYRRPARRVLRQIYTRRRSDAERAQRALARGGGFAEVARRLGQGPEAADGGLLGDLGRDELPPSLSKAAWRLKPGTYSPIVASHWGYHILYCESLSPAGPDDPDQASDQVRRDLLLDKEQAAFRNWLARLREAAAIVREPAAFAATATKGPS